MASRSPDGGPHGNDGNSAVSNGSDCAGGQPRGSHVSRDGDGCLGDGGDGDDDGDGDGDGDRDEVATAPSSLQHLEQSQKNKKKTKAKKKKKSKAKKKGLLDGRATQSSPPRVPLSEIFPSGDYPHGELQPYRCSNEGTVRARAAERHHHDVRQRYWDDATWLQNYRKAAEVHRQARQWIQETIRPGQTVEGIVAELETSVRALLGSSGLEPGDGRRCGLGFPTGLCLNNQVAHYTPNPGAKPVVVQQQDVVTVDFGVHIDGWIVDSAFTTAFDPAYDNLLAAVREATEAGVRTAGVDVRISDVSAAIHETMESYEVELGGRTFAVRPVRNISGHSIKQFRIHGGKSIPFVRNGDQTKMEEGEVFAIETFGSTGRGYVVDDVGVYGYGLDRDAALEAPVSLSSAAQLHRTIRRNFGTLVFCRRYLERLGVDRYLAGMRCLVSNGIVEEYRPLMDVKGSYSAQFEHTFLLRETHKEVFSRGPDY